MSEIAIADMMWDSATFLCLLGVLISTASGVTIPDGITIGDFKITAGNVKDHDVEHHDANNDAHKAGNAPITNNQSKSTDLKTNNLWENGIGGYVQNNCPFDIWVRSASCVTTSETPLQVIPANGGKYWNPVRARPDGCGVVMKLTRGPHFHPEYQVEYAIDAIPKLWYNLSIEDGKPSQDVSRFMEAGDGCPKIWCAPGDEGRGCEYPHQTDCMSVTDIKFYLC